MTIEVTVKDSARSCTNTQDISAQAGDAEYHAALSLKGWFRPQCLLEKASSAVWGGEHEEDVKDAEGALGQKESVAQVTPNQGG